MIDTTVNGARMNKRIETIPGNYESFFENVYETIALGKELIVKPEEALTTIQIIESAIKSNDNKCVIKFDE